MARHHMIDGVKVMFTSEEEVEADAADAASAAIDAEYVAKEKYKDDRRRAYPDLGDQMDMQYHDLLDGTTKWKDAIKAVKADFKKP